MGDYEFVCRDCGFTVPSSNEGVALLEVHLKSKHKKAQVIALDDDDLDDRPDLV